MRRQASAGGRGARVIAAAALAVLASCRAQGDESATNVGNAGAEPAAELPAAARPTPPMDRRALLAAAAEAASAAAAGLSSETARRELDGRQFELRIRFGCGGPSERLGEAPFGWSREPRTGTLRIRAEPTISADDPLVQQLELDDVEAVEGFWIPRPWMLVAACPAAAAARPAPVEAAGEEAADGDENAAAVAPVHPRVGIAQFFTSSDARTLRRADRPYEVTKTVPPEQPVGAQGFDLVLSGRLRALPGRGVVHCVVRGPDAPPDCILGAHIDRVRIEHPGERAPLAEWGSG